MGNSNFKIAYLKTKGIGIHKFDVELELKSTKWNRMELELTKWN